MRAKLIRDDMVVSQGGEVRPANSLPGRQLALVCKMHEEAEEIAKDACDPAEYADLFEVMLELMRINEVPWAQVEAALLRKRAERGGFRKGRIWVS